MPVPQLDTRGVNMRQGTMQGAHTVLQQQRTGNLASRNLLLQEELANRPQMRQRQDVMWQRGTEEYEQKKKETDLQYRELLKDIKEKDRKRLLEEKKDLAVRLLRVDPGDISTWQKEWDMLTAEKPEMIKNLESMGLSRDQITPEIHEDLKDMVLGETKVLTDYEAEKRSELEATKHRNALKEIGAREKSALNVVSARSKGPSEKKETAEQKALRTKIYSQQAEIRKLQTDVLMPNDKNVLEEASKKLKIMQDEYIANGGSPGAIGLEKQKPSSSKASKRYVYENGKVTLRQDGSGIPNKLKGTH